MIIAMTKRDQLNAIAMVTGLTTSQAAAAYSAVCGMITAGLLQDERVTISGLGTFSVRRRSARRVTNPATGVPMDLPPTSVVSFKPSAELREIVKTRWS